MSIAPFVFPGLRSRVIFGHGTIAETGAEIERLGHRLALVLSTPNQKADAEALSERLGKLSAGVFADATMHTPVEVTETALAAFRASGADCVVALGGGSTTGLGKAIATRTGADQVVIPTTYAGSEMTDILGETAAGAVALPLWIPQSSMAIGLVLLALAFASELVRVARGGEIRDESEASRTE